MIIHGNIGSGKISDNMYVREWKGVKVLCTRTKRAKPPLSPEDSRKRLRAAHLHARILARASEIPYSEALTICLRQLRR